MVSVPKNLSLFIENPVETPWFYEFAINISIFGQRGVWFCTSPNTVNVIHSSIMYLFQSAVDFLCEFFELLNVRRRFANFEHFPLKIGFALSYAWLGVVFSQNWALWFQNLLGKILILGNSSFLGRNYIFWGVNFAQVWRQIIPSHLPASVRRSTMHGSRLNNRPSEEQSSAVLLGRQQQRSASLVISSSSGTEQGSVQQQVRARSSVPANRKLKEHLTSSL